jgi:transposase-like protein
MKDYQSDELDAAIPLRESVSVVMADVAATMREGLLAMAVGAGLSVMRSLMEESVTAICGPKGKHHSDRQAVRHGGEDGSVTLGGRRVRVRRPRVRASDGSGEIAVPAYGLFSSTDLLGEMAMTRMLAKVSTRRYRVGLEPVGAEVEQRATSTSKSAVSRRFVAATENALADLLGTDLSGLDLVALMIDGVYFAEHLCVVAMGIGVDGTKHPLAVVEGSTENATLVGDVLVGLRDRGVDVTRPILVVIDGAKALATAVRAVFDRPIVARCQLHKVRNVKAKLPKGWLTPWPPRCTPPTGSTPRWPPNPLWRTWPANSSVPIPVSPRRFARDSKIPSPSRASACHQPWPVRCDQPTPSSR